MLTLHHSVKLFQHWAEVHPWAMPVLGALVAFTENIFPPFPGDVLIFALGVAARHVDPLGQVATAPLVVTTLVGCVIGGVFGALAVYHVGITGGRAVLHGWGRRFVSPQTEVRMETQFARWGLYLVMISRVIPGIRTAVSLYSGIMELGRWPFALAQSVAQTVQYAILCGIGYLAADPRILRAITQGLGMVGVGALVILGLVIWLVNIRRARKTAA